MSGQLQRAKSLKEPKAPHTHVVITFTQGGQLRFVDPRTFGELFVSDAPVDGSPPLPELAHLGFDPLENVMSWEKFWVLLSARKAGLKALLMDQEFVAGIGNMYADEILFAAGLRYDRMSNSLSSQEVRRLYRAMVETLAAPGLRPRGGGLPALSRHHRAGQVGRTVDLLLRALPGLTDLAPSPVSRLPGPIFQVLSGPRPFSPGTRRRGCCRPRGISSSGYRRPGSRHPGSRPGSPRRRATADRVSARCS
jgi:hypothetical protein